MAPSWVAAAPLLVPKPQGSRAAAQPDPPQAMPTYSGHRHRPRGSAVALGEGAGVLSPPGLLTIWGSRHVPSDPQLQPIWGHKAISRGPGGGAWTKHVRSRHHDGHAPKFSF
ncbi:hypothetical protein NDU88_004390 [Pleurodeles waltl]|uniref:Uncharacterized protein n=1 Tax=Pleurodeles waltl TaxID=8319 RepID=A0AAV7SIT1_PLEWA|nr:hypothetical protein NDU88_004390 [Pleurodeles waltl]